MLKEFQITKSELAEKIQVTNYERLKWFVGSTVAIIGLTFAGINLLKPNQAVVTPPTAVSQAPTVNQNQTPHP